MTVITTTPTTTTTTTSTTTTTTTSIPILDQNYNKTVKQSCTDGWSAWINVNKLSSKGSNRFEYLPTFEDLNSTEMNSVNGLDINVR